MKRIGVAIAMAATVGALALPSGNAFADLYVGPTPIVTVDQCVVVKSPTVTITTAGFPDGVQLNLVITPTTGTTITSTIPANTGAAVPTPPVGSYQLTVTDAAGDHASTGFDVGTCTSSNVAPAAAVSPPVPEPAAIPVVISSTDLPTTGLNADLMIRFAAIALLSGLGMAAVARRRRRTLATTDR